MNVSKGMEKTIFLIRHAEPIGVTQEWRYLGQQDPDLSPFGIQQAEKLGLAFRSYSIQAVFTSDLLRAVHTTLLIFKNHHGQPERMREFREISLGEWDGKTVEEVQALYPKEYEQRGRDIVNYRTPGGESYVDVEKRVLPAFMAVVEKTNGNIVIVAHAGVNRVILCYLMQRPLQDLFSIPQDYTAVNIIRENMGSYRVVTINTDSDGLMSQI
jgi:alpha-ribazole phosphatase